MSEEDIIRDHVEKLRARAKDQPDQGIGIHVDENDPIAVEALFRFIEEKFDDHLGASSETTKEIADAKSRFREAVHEMRQTNP